MVRWPAGAHSARRPATGSRTLSRSGSRRPTGCSAPGAPRPRRSPPSRKAATASGASISGRSRSKRPAVEGRPSAGPPAWRPSRPARYGASIDHRRAVAQETPRARRSHGSESDRCCDCCLRLDASVSQAERETAGMDEGGAQGHAIGCYVGLASVEEQHCHRPLLLVVQGRGPRTGVADAQLAPSSTAPPGRFRVSLSGPRRADARSGGRPADRPEAAVAARRRHTAHRCRPRSSRATGFSIRPSSAVLRTTGRSAGYGH